MSVLEQLTPPKEGQRIEINDGRLRVPNQPIVPFIEGDGTGPDIWRASQRVFDASVQKAYGGGGENGRVGVFVGEESEKKFEKSLPGGTGGAVWAGLVWINKPVATAGGGGGRAP